MPEGRTKRPTTGRPVPPRSTQVVLSGSTATVRVAGSDVEARAVEREDATNLKHGGDDVLECVVAPGIGGELLGLGDWHGLVRGPELIDLRETHLDSRSRPRADPHDPLDPSPGMDGEFGRAGERFLVRFRKALGMLHEDPEWLGLGREAETAVSARDDLRIARLMELAVVELCATHGSRGRPWRRRAACHRDHARHPKGRHRARAWRRT